MPNALVAAAAEGLPSALFNRRRMLLGLAAASTAAASPVAVAASSAPAENMALICLGDQTSALLGAYRAAVAVREAIVKEWGPQWPALPAEIRNYGSPGEVAYDLEGNWPQPYATYHAPEYLKSRAARLREPKSFRKGTSPLTIAKRAASMEKFAAQEEARVALSEMYCAEHRRVREQSGIRAAQIAEREARIALSANVSAIMTSEPVTMVGAIIQAQALEALSAVPPLQRGEPGLQALQQLPVWGERLAASILRLARSAA